MEAVGGDGSHGEVRTRKRPGPPLGGRPQQRLTQGFLFAEVQPILHVMFFQASLEQPEIHGSTKEKSAKDNNAS